MRRILAVLLAAATLLTAAPSWAADDERTPTQLSVLLDPMLLFLPLGQLTAEYKLHPMLGIAVLGGYGQVTSERNAGFGFVNVTQPVLRVGGQANAYLWGNFASGSHFGVELLYQRIGEGDDNLTKASDNTQLGLYGGYKYTHMLSPTLGLTALLQAGYTFELHSSSTTTSTATVYRFNLPSDTLLNIKLGMSF